MSQATLPPHLGPDPTAPTSPEPAWAIAHLFPLQGQWSEADYLALQTNHLVELSDGAIEVHPLPTFSHQRILLFLYRALEAFVTARQLGHVATSSLPVRLWDRTFREPDILFMRAENAHRCHEPYWDRADLVMEVVSTDRTLDLETKRQEYARAGIPEYWIVDPKLRRIIVLGLAGDAYVPLGDHGSGDRAVSALLPGFGVEVAEVFAA